MKTRLIAALCVMVLYATGASIAKDWANSEGSCYAKGDKNISFGMSGFHYLGFYGAFDYGFHDAISGGVASGFNTDITGTRSVVKYYYLPIVVRGAFHPFNLNVLSEKIKIRNKLDPYAGISMGARIGWTHWEGIGPKPKAPYRGFVFREYIGVRFFPVEKFYLSLEEGCGLGNLNFGVGFKF